MGIFYQYGAEYGATLLDGSYITIIPMDVFDDRLKNSPFLKALEEEYRDFHHQKLYQCDIVLSEEEEQYVAQILQQVENIQDHGFYWTTTISSTY